jgi:hypothetical protein
VSEDERAIVQRAVEQVQGITGDLEHEPAPDQDVAQLLAFEARVAERLRQIAEELQHVAGDARRPHTVSHREGDALRITP